jgi:hypothetical protein
MFPPPDFIKIMLKKSYDTCADNFWGTSQWGALIRLKKTENGAKQNSAVKTKWLLIVFWGPPNNTKKVNFNFVCP